MLTQDKISTGQQKVPIIWNGTFKFPQKFTSFCIELFS